MKLQRVISIYIILYYDKDEEDRRMVWLATTKKSLKQHTKERTNHKSYSQNSVLYDDTFSSCRL